MDTVDLEQFRKAVELEQKDEPEDDNPYRFKYEARTLMETLLQKLQNVDIPQTDLKVTSEAGLLLKIGLNKIDTSEVTNGESDIRRSIHLLSQLETNPHSIATMIACLNGMGFLAAQRSDFEGALDCLTKAKALFLDFQKDHETASENKLTDWPLDLHSVLILLTVRDGPDVLSEHAEQRRREIYDNFEELHTMTLYYLAQVHRNLGQTDLSAEACQKTLSRQLSSKSINKVDWATNCAALSQYYISVDGKEDFVQARHCLACALDMATLAESEYNTKGNGSKEPTSENDDLECSLIKKTLADTYRCFTKYGLALLDASKIWLCDTEEDQWNSAQTTKDRADTLFLPSSERVQSLEKDIPAVYARNFEEAKLIFMKSQNFLNKAKQFYELNSHCSDYVELQQDHSKLFKLLAFFEADYGRKAKMHKRRQDILDAVHKELNPQYYLLLCRQLLFELAEICNEMLDIKLDLTVNEHKEPNNHQREKINHLCREGMKYFTQFLDSFKDKEGNLPDQYLEHAKSVILARFYIARLLEKIIVADPKAKLELSSKALSEYKWIVAYCDSDPDAKKVCEIEYNLAVDMVALLPGKLEKLRHMIL